MTMNMKRIIQENINIITKEHPLLLDNERHEAFLYQTYHVKSEEKRPLYDFVTLTAWYTNSEGVRGFLYTSVSASISYAIDLTFTSGTLCDLHEHSHIELIYIAEGTLKIVIGEEEHIFSQGEFILINSGIRHGEYLYREDCTLVCLDVDDSFFTKYDSIQQKNDYTLSLKKLINEKRSQYLFIRFSPIKGSPQTIAALTTILCEMCGHLPGRKRIVIGYVERIVDLLTKEFHIQIAKQDTADLHTALLQDIQTYVRCHYDTVTVGQIGDTFHFSPDYLNRVFRRMTGMTLSTYIQDIRLSEAMHLLNTTENSVESIAEKIGYHNLGFFYRKFKEKYHQLPGEIKKM